MITWIVRKFMTPEGRKLERLLAVDSQWEAGIANYSWPIAYRELQGPAEIKISCLWGYRCDFQFHLTGAPGMLNFADRSILRAKVLEICNRPVRDARRILRDRIARA